MAKESGHLLEWSADGQPFSTAFGDSFYSQTDGRAETNHVFIAGNGLLERWSSPDEFTIGELGFGTGLNFLETLRQWRAVCRPSQCLRFISVEAFPLSVQQIEKALSAWPELQDLVSPLVENWEACRESMVAMDAQTQLHVIEAPVTQALEHMRDSIDAWYFDGFSPSRNPDMWSPEVFAKVAKLTKPGGTFASYTSAGWVRRNLQSAGFAVEKRPGFGRKRDMIAGHLEAAT